jgi:hypothetical protein
MFNKGCIFGEKNFERYQNARNNNKKNLMALLLGALCQGISTFHVNCLTAS